MRTHTHVQVPRARAPLRRCRVRPSVGLLVLRVRDSRAMAAAALVPRQIGRRKQRQQQRGQQQQQRQQRQQRTRPVGQNFHALRDPFGSQLAGGQRAAPLRRVSAVRACASALAAGHFRGRRPRSSAPGEGTPDSRPAEGLCERRPCVMYLFFFIFSICFDVQLAARAPTRAVV